MGDARRDCLVLGVSASEGIADGEITANAFRAVRPLHG